MTGRRWVVTVIVALLVVGLVAFARGREHHRGQQVGAMGDAPTTSAVVTDAA
jgi:hypothetical protein